jgi:hypothetical protein
LGLSNPHLKLADFRLLALYEFLKVLAKSHKFPSFIAVEYLMGKRRARETEFLTGDISLHWGVLS